MKARIMRDTARGRSQDARKALGQPAHRLAGSEECRYCEEIGCEGQCLDTESSLDAEPLEPIYYRPIRTQMRRVLFETQARVETVSLDNYKEKAK